MSAGSDAPAGAEIHDVAARKSQDSPASLSVTPATSEPTLRTPERLEDPKHPEIDTRILSPSGSRAERSSGESLRVCIESQSSGPARLYESLTGEVRRCLQTALSEVGLTAQDKENRKETLVKGSNFTSEQLQVLSTLAVVAVLIVNVTYFGWAQPPGGATPSWQGCSYRYLLLFQLLNGIAFVLSMTAVVAVTLLPLTLPMHPRYAVWCGSVLVALSSGILIAAFMFAGLVANGYAAPSPMCAAVRCNQGGVPCSLGQLPHTFGNTTVFAMDDNLAKLNGLTSPALCFGLDFGHGISQNLSTFLFTLISDLNLPDVLCASVASTTVNRGFSSSLNVFLKDLPGSFLAANSTFRPTASLSDLLGALDPQTVVPYKKLRYICYSDIKHSRVSSYSSTSLCDTWAQVPNSIERLSVNPSGAYLTAATMLTNGGSLFVSEDITLNSANSLSDASSFAEFFLLDVVPYHGLDPKVLGVLAGVFACCMLGLAILVGAAHWSKVLTDVHCQMQLHMLHPISTIFRNLATGLYNKVPKRGKHSAS